MGEYVDAAGVVGDAGGVTQTASRIPRASMPR
jgi:hypothetical protein